MADRPRVLVLAEAANPRAVSVPLVGWSLATALRRVADVHVVTQIRNREAFLGAGLVEGADFTALDTDAVQRRVWRVSRALRGGRGTGWTTATAFKALSYPYFERRVWQEFGAAIRGGAYDVVHRVTPVTPTAPSPIARRCAAARVPFVLGPLNGGLPWPPGFDAERRREREWLSYMRGAYRLLPGRSATLAASAAILVGSRHTESEIPAPHRARCVWIPENAIDPARFNLVADHAAGGPLRAAFVGRLVPYKGPDMLIEAAAAHLAAGQLELDIVGDGPMRAALEGQARAAGVAGAVRFHGWLEHAEVQGVLARCPVLAFPSVREFGGGVVLEAMALGAVPIVVDYGGPGELVVPGTGRKIPLGRRDAIVARLSEALGAAIDDRPGLAETGERARAHVRERHAWAHRAETIAGIYARVMAGEPPA